MKFVGEISLLFEAVSLWTRYSSNNEWYSPHLYTFPTRHIPISPSLSISLIRETFLLIAQTQCLSPSLATLKSIIRHISSWGGFRDFPKQQSHHAIETRRRASCGTLPNHWWPEYESRLARVLDPAATRVTNLRVGEWSWTYITIDAGFCEEWTARLSRRHRCCRIPDFLGCPEMPCFVGRFIMLRVVENGLLSSLTERDSSKGENMRATTDCRREYLAKPDKWLNNTIVTSFPRLVSTASSQVWKAINLESAKDDLPSMNGLQKRHIERRQQCLGLSNADAIELLPIALEKYTH